MKELQSGFVPYEMKSSLIRFVSYENKNPQGFISNPYYSEDVYFDNLTQFVFLLEDLQDSISYPQRAMESRSFAEGAKNAFMPVLTHPSEEIKTAPVIASFKINVLFRQNASWQGNLVWIENQTEAQFRSVLEVIKLIDSVLS